MATPIVPASHYADLITVTDGVALLRRTGHPASKSTIQRWVKDGRLEASRHGRIDFISVSALMKVHRDVVVGRSR